MVKYVSLLVILTQQDANNKNEKKKNKKERKQAGKKERKKADSEGADSPLWYMLIGTCTELKPVLTFSP
jgi:hypothetical protein